MMERHDPPWQDDFADEAEAVAWAPNARPLAPLIFSSPHSGRHYPPSFCAASKLDPLALRRSEDAFMDELYGAAPSYGAALLHALFPRAYCDPNREPYEWDPALFNGPLPAHVKTDTPRVLSGFGTIAALVADGERIYRAPIALAEAEQRIERCWRPYHAQLARLIAQARAQFGLAIVVDCHSMPSVGGPTEQDRGQARPDFVLGDLHGASCDGRILECAARNLTAMGYRVARNNPYAGGYITSHYGRPRDGVHVLQVEINRALYMDEARIERGPGFERTRADVTRLIAALVALSESMLRRAAE